MEPTSTAPLIAVSPTSGGSPRAGRWSAGLIGLVVGLLLGGLGMYLAVGGDDREALSSTAAVETTAAVPSTTAAPVTVVPMGGTCADERRVLEVAFEAYYADNGEEATDFAVLVGDFLREDPSARWTFTPGSPPTIVGIGTCAGS